MGWDDVTGQADAVAACRAAAETGEGMTHAWLITGPPGSGRSVLATAFAEALIARQGDQGVRARPSGDAGPPARPGGDAVDTAATARQVRARPHPDLAVLSTEKVTITIDEVRALVAQSQFSPSLGRYRVMVIEDADRMTERTSNVLLKALEEPPERTVWILCAPSEADLLPTIRSRARSVRLRVPGVEEVAALLERRDGIDPETARRAAREAQSHIGMARRLARDPEARARRDRTLELALGIRSAAGAVNAVAELVEVATEDARAVTEERDARERDDLLRSLGVEPGGTVPTALRTQVKQLDDDQKRRATRSLRDGLDRVLVDLLSLYRDIVLVQLGLPDQEALVNVGAADRIVEAAREATPAQTLATLDALAEARERLAANVAPTLAVEGALVAAVRRRERSAA